MNCTMSTRNTSRYPTPGGVSTFGMQHRSSESFAACPSGLWLVENSSKICFLMAGSCSNVMVFASPFSRICGSTSRVSGNVLPPSLSA